jgi:ABC-type dipeptide/oligopeptide/nickel transport system ATPase component
VLGLVGESGSGKSQTAFSILACCRPTRTCPASSMQFGGQELEGLSRAAMNKLRGRHIAYIPQEPMSNLDPSFKIGSQLVEPMRQHLGLSGAEAKQKALGLLERVGIPDPPRVFDAYPHEISGGMAQRVLIAGAVSCDPELLIADEPTTALDVTVQAEVLDLIRSLEKERNMGVILVTHDFGVVADICDTVAVMQSGKVVETAPAAELFADPQHPYTRMLLDSTLEDSEPRRPRVAATARTETGMTTTAPNHDASRCSSPTTSSSSIPAGFRKPPFKALKGVSVDIARGRDARAGRRVGLRQDDARPGDPRPGARHRRRDPLRGPRHLQHRQGGAPRAQRRHPGRLPGPLHVAEPGDDGERHPHRAAARRGRLAPGGRPPRAGPARPGAAAGRRRPAPAARVLRRPAPAHRHRPRALARPEGDRLRRAGQRARPLQPGRVLDLFIEIQERTASPTCSSRTTSRSCATSATASP